MTRCTRGVLIALCLLGSRGARAQGAEQDSLAARETAVFRQLQRAIAANDRQAAAELFVYPFRVNHSSRIFFRIRTRQELLRRFDAILPDTVRGAILRQNPNSLFHNWKGTMVGRGEVWIGGVCTGSPARRCRYGVTAINLPAPRPR